jgi:hypothetical protein
MAESKMLIVCRFCAFEAINTVDTLVSPEALLERDVTNGGNLYSCVSYTAKRNFFRLFWQVRLLQVIEFFLGEANAFKKLRTCVFVELAEHYNFLGSLS